MEVSTNGGTLEAMVYVREHPIVRNGWWLGVPPFQETHLSSLGYHIFDHPRLAAALFALGMWSWHGFISGHHPPWYEHPIHIHILMYTWLIICIYIYRRIETQNECRSMMIDVINMDSPNPQTHCLTAGWSHSLWDDPSNSSSGWIFQTTELITREYLPFISH